MATIIDDLAHFAAHLSFKDIPLDAVERARTLIIHHLSTASAASAYEHRLDAPRVAVDIAKNELGLGECSIVAHSFTSKPTSAAFVNGVLMHSIQQEDTSTQVPMMGWHPGPVLIPSVLAAGEMMEASGEEVITAAIVAYEVSIRLVEIGAKTGETSFRMPYFIFGGAASVGVLLGLSEEEIALALGNAAEFPAGLGRLWMNEGTIGAVLSMGCQAQNSILAGLLGKKKAPASKMALENDSGFYKVYTGAVPKPSVVKDSLGDLGEEFNILKMIGKPHTCFTHVQSTVDAVLNSMQRANLNKDSIANVQVKPSPHQFRAGFSDSPGPFSSIYKAYSSQPLAIALAVFYNQVQIENMLEFENSEVLQFAKRNVTLEVDKNGKDFCPHVVLTTKDRKGIPYYHEDGIVEPSMEKILQKLERYLSRSVSQSKVKQAVKLAPNLEKLDNIVDLTQNLRS